MPAAAEANKAVFYESGRPRSVAEVHAYFSRKLGQPIEAQVATAGWVPSPSPGQTLPVRADAPPISANAAFMVHVLLQALATDHLENAVRDEHSGDESESADAGARERIPGGWPGIDDLQT